MTSVSAFFRNNSKRWSYATWINPDRGYLYIENPKVGCTTVKQLLQTIDGLSLPPNEQQIHYRNPPDAYVRSAIDYIDQIDRFIEEHIFIFTFVRDPASRLVSAYKDKIVRSHGQFWQNYRDDIRRVCSLLEDQPISFSNFVFYVESIPDAQRDIHWRSQFALLRPDVIPYGFIGKFERFQTDLQEVLKLITKNGRDNRIQPTNSTKNVNDFDDSYETYFERIRSIYRKDCEAFGYCSPSFL